MPIPRRIRGVLAATLAGCLLASSAGVAVAEPNPAPPVPSLIDQLLTSTPALWADPRDQNDAQTDSGTVGMYCQNLGVKCR